MAQCEIQQLANTGIAVDIIADYAEDSASNPAPSVQNYADAGIVGVTADNIDAANDAVAKVSREDADTPNEIQDVLNNATDQNDNPIPPAPQTTSATIINEYAKDPIHNQEPTVEDYHNVGQTEVNSGNIAIVNEVVAKSDDASTPEIISELVTTGIAIDKIADYAQDNSNPAPTVDDYANAGVVGITDDNITAANSAIDAASREQADSSDEIQNILNSTKDQNDNPVPPADTTIAATIIKEYAQDSIKNPTPTVENYAKVGETDVTADNIDMVNQVIAKSGDASTPELIDMLVAKGVALDKIADYAEDSNNPAPTAHDYAAAGVVGVTANNLSKANETIAAKERTEADTVDEIQDVLAHSSDTDVSAQTAAAAKIKAYAEDHINNPAPEVEDYNLVGVEGVNSGNIEAVNKTVETATCSM